MKQVILIFAFVILFSCKKEEKQEESVTSEVATIEKGQALFEEFSCAACHQPEQKIIGPGLKEIAEIYKKQNGDMVSFLKEEAPPIVDEKLYETMKINLQITKTKSDAELKSLEMFILSHSK